MKKGEYRISGYIPSSGPVPCSDIFDVNKSTIQPSARVILLGHDGTAPVLVKKSPENGKREPNK